MKKTKQQIHKNEEFNKEGNAQLQLPMSLEDQLLDVTDMSKIFKVRKQMIYKWKKRKLIKPVKFSRKLTFHRADVQAFIDKTRKEQNLNN